MSNICSHHIYMKMLLNLADHYNKASSEQIAVHSLLVACFCCSLGGGECQRGQLHLDRITGVTASLRLTTDTQWQHYIEACQK